MTDDLIPQVADRFRALSEPARLLLLRALMTGGEQTVNELVLQTRLGQANVSKHLQVLHALGFLRRRKNGLFVHYALADRQVVKLVDLMCERALQDAAPAGTSPGEPPAGDPPGDSADEGTDEAAGELAG